MTSHESSTTRFQPHNASPCALIEDLLPLYVEGEVSPAARDLIVEHLANCDHCAGFLAGAQSVRAQLRHDQQSRNHIIIGDQPAFQTVHAFQFAVVMGIALALGTLGLFAFALLDSYGARQLLALLVPLGAAIAGGYALTMLVKQQRGKHRADHWLPLGALTALGGMGLLVLFTQFDLLVRIASSVLRHTPVYLLYRLYWEFPIMTLGAFAIMLALLVRVAFIVARKHGPTNNPG